METQTFLRWMVGFLVCFSAAHADSAAPVVRNEYAKQQTQMEGELFTARKNLLVLEAAREKAIQESKAEALVNLEGLKAFKQYYTLLLNRYSNPNMQFQPWKAVQAKDVENINNLFDTYLRSKPLKGRVSAGQADKTLDWGMSRLEEIYKVHKSPKTDNNSDLEIIAHEIKEAEANIDAIRSQAARLDIKLVDRDPREVAASPEGTTPESTPQQ